MRMGEAIPGGQTDVLYAGADPNAGPLSLDYYRDKARQFQVTLNALDQGYAAAWNAIDADIDDELSVDLFDLTQEFDAKRTLLIGTAKAINAGAEAINALGGRFPVLSVPSGLGLLPVLPLAAVAAIATAATLIVWGNQWLKGLNERLKRAQLIAEQREIDPAKAAALVDSIAASDMAVSRSETSPLSAIAGTVKWIALGVGAFLVYRAWSDSRRAG